MTLSEFIMDIAESEAKKKINDIIEDFIVTLADEIIETAEEYEPETDHS